MACPGSGKTEAVSRRVARLIKKGVPPANIVAFTFTRKAAEELKLRIRRVLEDECPDRSDFGDMYVGTIDSFCLYMLKELKPEYRSFEVLDSARRTAFVDRWYYDMGFRDMQETRRRWDTIKMFCDSADLIMTEKVDVSKISNRVFVECHCRYMEKLKDERFFDFTSVIYALLELLRNDRKALRRLNRLVKHVVLDEYQDVNMIQEELLALLSKGSDSVCVVGDDDQNIFQWRGSNVRHIIDFPEKYKQHSVTTEKLDVNYRATSGLIETANQLIENNSVRIEKGMKVSKTQKRRFEYGDIVHHHFDTDRDEFDSILKNIRGLKDTDFTDRHGCAYALSYQDMAVIVSTNRDAARVTSFLEQNGIDCIADSGFSVFERPIVALATDCICYVFRCDGYTTGNEVPNPSNLAQRYRGITGRDPGKFRKNLARIRKRADGLAKSGKSGWLPGLGLQEFFQRILVAMGSENGVLEGVDLYNLAVLSTAISDYEYVYRTLRTKQVSGLKWFIIKYAETAYSDPRHNDPTLVDAVRILTIWKAKGLEFPVVFIPAFVKKGKPPKSERFVDDHLYTRQRYDGDIEDSRRAYYTAVTRSQKYLFLTGARRRVLGDGRPSRREIHPHPFAAELKNDRVSTMRHPKKPKSRNKTLVQAEGTFPTSYSELSMYERCPYDYQLRHVFGFNAGVPAAFGYGTNIHNILNLIHSDFIQDGRVPTSVEIDEIFDRMFYMRFAPGSQNENMKKAGSNVVKNYVNLHGSDFGRILETEKRFEFTVGKALISGDIDLLKKVDSDGKTTEIEIIDFKTEKQKEDGRYELDHSEQVRFYSYATRESLGYKPKKALIHHLDTNEKDNVDISNTSISKTTRKISDSVEKIISRDFEATPDEEKCNGCDFRALCHHKGFDIGVDFRQAGSGARSSPEAGAGDGSAWKPAVPTPYVMKRAREIASQGLTRNTDGSFSVPSGSDPNRSYTVTESDCQCQGFKRLAERRSESAPTCSHIEAVRIVTGKTGGA